MQQIHTHTTGFKSNFIFLCLAGWKEKVRRTLSADPRFQLVPVKRDPVYLYSAVAVQNDMRLGGHTFWRLRADSEARAKTEQQDWLAREQQWCSNGNTHVTWLMFQN